MFDLSPDKFNLLNETDLHIYKYIQNNIDKVIFMNITELSSELFISTASIIRFAKKIGFSGCNGSQTV